MNINNKIPGSPNTWLMIVIGIILLGFALASLIFAEATSPVYFEYNNANNYLNYKFTDSIMINGSRLIPRTELDKLADDTTNSKTAFSWGDHSAQGYLSNLLSMYGFMDRTYFDTTTAFVNDSLIVIFTDDADTNGVQINAALNNRADVSHSHLDGEIADNITITGLSDSTNWNSYKDSIYVNDTTALSVEGYYGLGDTLHQDTTRYLAIQDTSGLFGGGLLDTILTKDTVFLLGSADTTLKLTRDATNDTTKLSVPTGVLVIEGDTTGTPSIDFGLANPFDSSLADSMINQKGDYVHTTPIDSTVSVTMSNGFKFTSSVVDSAFITKHEAANITNPTFIGDYEITGYLKKWGFKTDIDIDSLRFPRADTFLSLPIPAYARNPVNNDNDQYHVVHPSAVYIPQGWNGYKHWLVVTPLAYLTTKSDSNFEAPVLYRSNDNITWDTVSTTNPVIDENDINTTTSATYFSDAELFYGADSKLWLITRASYDGTPPVADTNWLFVQSSTDGDTWTSPVEILEQTATGLLSGTDTLGAKGFDLISPSVILDTSGIYKMWTVQLNNWVWDSSGTYVFENDTNTMMLWEALTPDGTWDTVQTVDYTYPTLVNELYDKKTGADTLVEDIWHPSVLQLNADQLLMFVKTTGMGGSGGDGSLFIAKSTDGGRSFIARDRPILDQRRYPDSKWDGDYPYRASAIIVGTGNEQRIGLYYSAFGSDDSLGANKGRFTGYTESTYRDTIVDTRILDFNTIYGRYGGTPATDSLVLTNSVYINYQSYLWVDSSYDNSTTVSDTINATLRIPEDVYFKADSFIIAGVSSNASDVKITDIIITSNPLISATSDFNTTAYTETKTANLADVSVSALDQRRVVQAIIFDPTILAREAFALSAYRGISNGLYFRPGSRVQIRVVVTYTTGVSDYLRCAYMSLKGHNTEKLSDDERDMRLWLH